MRTLKPLLLAFIFLFFCNTTQAQFWKKLAKKAEKKIEQEAEKRAERRVNKKIDKVFDGAENTIDGKNKKKINIPSSYTFDWKYTLQMETKKGDMKMHYMLKKNATYFGIVMVLDEIDTNKNTVTIMDIENKAFITLMYMQGQKTIMTRRMPNMDTEDTEADIENLNFIKTDTKEILGYSCQGFKTQMNDGTMYMYIAKNAPVSFNRAFGNNKNIPKGLNQKLIKELENGIMLEANFISNKNKKHNFKTTCIELKEMKYTLDLSSYKPIGFGK